MVEELTPEIFQVFRKDIADEVRPIEVLLPEQHLVTDQ
jgi:hypothetical protein